jgi:RNA polymerase sigma-70 factor (family 1)
MEKDTKVTDTDLLKNVSAGDEIAFSRLFDRYRPNIYTTALRLTNDTSIAEEILQDVFLKVWLNREKLPEIQNFGGWIYKIGKNITYNSIRNSQKERNQLLQLMQESLEAQYKETDHLAQEREFNAILQKAIDRLPARQKQTYILIKQMSKKREEVAAELQVSPETVKSNLEQAMKSIRAFCLAHLEDVPRIFMLYYFTKKI